MKVLILSCNTGEGHNSTAAAIQETFLNQSVPCDIRDALAFLSKHTSEFIRWGHVFVYRYLPKLFGVGYRFEENHAPRFITKKSARGADALHSFICKNGYDTVICVHVFAGLMMTAMRNTYDDTPPFYFVATDYTCSPGAAECQADVYFIPHPALAAEFEGCGVPADRLIASGIPVKNAFCTSGGRTAARAALQIPADSKMIMLSLGSMGCGPMKKITINLIEQLPPDVFLVVICGYNRRLYRQLESLRSTRVRILGFTKRMPLYMDAADLFLTKAGGLSTTEAIAKRLPMLYVDAIQGCESHNRDFMLQHGITQCASNPDTLTAMVRACLDDPAQLNRQIDAMQRNFPSCGAAELCREVISRHALDTKGVFHETRS